MYSNFKINTYNESSLHKELKEHYASLYNGKTEAPLEDSICDILCEDKTIIEIQTGSFSNILAKLMKLVKNHKIILVYPLPQIKIIEKYSQSGDLLERRKSPKKQNIFHLFDQLMRIYPLLLEKNFKLEVLLTEQIEKRLITEEPVQLQNKSRRFKKNYIKTDKILKNINEKYNFNSIIDYLNLIPFPTDTIFCTKDLGKITGINNAYKIIWVLKKLALLDFVEKKGKTNFYKLNKSKIKQI